MNVKTAGTRCYKILIVDDHPIVRQGLTQAINHEADLEVCGEAESAQEAMEFLSEALPDIALVDISLKDVNGIELIKNIQAAFPKLPVLVVSMHDETRYAERALRAGARGYVMKDTRIEGILAAARQVLKGSIYLSEKMTPELISKAYRPRAFEGESPSRALSDREMEVFQLIGRGMTTRQVAERLRLSPKTIETYCAQIKRKLSFKSPVELHQQAFHWVQGGELA